MIEAEQSIIGTILSDKQKAFIAIEKLSESDFTSDLNKNIFRFCCDLINENQEIDMFLVAEKFDCLPYLTDVMTSHQIAVGACIDLIKRESFRRRALSNIRGATETIIEADTIDQQMEAVELIREGLEVDTDDVIDFNDLVKSAIESFKDRLEGKKQKGLKTGFTSIDDRIGGFEPSDMVVIAGRPSMGKTTYAMNIAENVAENGGNVLVFSLEMSADQLLDRMLASATGVSLGVIKKPTNEKFCEGVQQKMIIGGQRLKKRRMSIVDRGDIHIDHLRNIARKFHRTKKLDLIVIDYIQLIHGSGENRFNEISSISRSIKAMAKELDVPVIALSQLSRSVDSRADSRPVNSDLRESGQIEQDADIIQFLYRDEIYNDKDSNPNKGLAEVITRKFRNGEVGTDYLESQLHLSKFVNTNRTHQQPPQNNGNGYRPSY